jgi:lipoprotein-anchoring transpeptidase ErfK/SrfK
MLTRRTFIPALVATGLLIPSRLRAQALDPRMIDSAEFDPQLNLRKGGPSATIARLQIMLDRAAFSPGIIDAHGGDNTANALAAFRSHHDFGDGKGLSEDVWRELQEGFDGPALREYEITKEDVEGPFLERLPEKFEEQAELDHLGYTSPLELLSEKFHMSEDLLRALNGDVDFSKEGQRITVANVERDTSDKASFVEVDTTENYVRAYSEDDELLAHYPATVGSESRPAPKGTFKIVKVVEKPVYTYDPKRVNFEGVKAEKPFDIAPGPNNPVGMVWIELDEDGYGIHGTPDPARIAKSYSHGCIRLTNWDALHLARMVRKGVEVEID